MRGRPRVAAVVGVLLVIGGFAVVGVSWDAALARASLEEQTAIAFLGGLAGLGLVTAGCGVLVVAAQRGLTADRARALRRVQERVDAAIRSSVVPGPGEVVEDETVIDATAGTVVRTVVRRPAPTAPAAGDTPVTTAAGPAPTGGPRPGPDTVPAPGGASGTTPPGRLRPSGPGAATSATGSTTGATGSTTGATGSTTGATGGAAGATASDQAGFEGPVRRRVRRPRRLRRRPRASG